MEPIMISFVYWTHDREYAFQRVGNEWRLYRGRDGVFVRSFRSFNRMDEYIAENSDCNETGTVLS